MSAPTSPSKRTAGEELFLVHLRRTNSPHHDHAEDEDDHDTKFHEIPRKRSRSIGEELFLTHLKRSEGLDPDYDTDPEVDASNASDVKGKDAAAEKKAVSKKKTPTDDVKTTDAMETDDNAMHLRDGRIILHKSQ